VLLVGLALAGRPGPARSAAEAPLRPNIVLIVSDDQRWDTVGKCLGGFDGADLDAGASACMPSLQSQLMANGTTFPAAHVTTSLCCPSRSSILTGRYARYTGVIDNFSGGELDVTNTLNVWLDAAGYRTGLVGKWLNEYGQPDGPWPQDYLPPGWDWWTAFWGDLDFRDYRLAESRDGGPVTAQEHVWDPTDPTDACVEGNRHADDLLCARVLQFLAQPSTDPFFLLLASHAPHPPFTPPVRWDGWADGIERPEYPSLNAVPTPNTPGYLASRQPYTADQLARFEHQFRDALESTRAIDDGIGAIRAGLAADGRLPNTVFVYVSDNGYAFGEHRSSGKDCIYEECHRVPIVIDCPPAVCPDAVPGRVVSSPLAALNIDLAPTISELAGIAPGGPVDGRSLVPWLRSDATDWRTHWLFEDRALERSGVVALLGDEHLYKYAQIETAPGEELYDLTADPWELTNLSKNSAYADELSQLRAIFASYDEPPQPNAPPTASITAPPLDALLSAKKVSVFWSASDDVAVLRTDLYERIPPSGTATRVQSGTGTSFVRTGTLGRTYCYAVTAVDGEGATGSSGEHCAAVPYDDRATQFTRSGTLDALSATGAYQGTLMRMNAAGEAMTLPFTGRRVGVLARTTSSSGKMRVWVDGALATTVDLYAAQTADRVYVYTASLSPASHTLRLAWDGGKNPASSGKVVLVDGVAVLR